MAEWPSEKLGQSHFRSYNSWYYHCIEILFSTHQQVQSNPHIDQFSINTFKTIFGEVRDWHYPHDAPFGGEGGELVLQRLLAADEDQPFEVVQYFSYKNLVIKLGKGSKTPVTEKFR